MRFSHLYVWVCILLIRVISWKGATTSIEGKVNFVVMTSCDTINLLWSWLDNIITDGLSNCAHMKGGGLGAQTFDTYTREWGTNELKSHPSVHGSWKYAGGTLSESKRNTYTLVSLSLVARVIKILPKRALKVTPTYTYDPTTLIGLYESVRWHLVLAWAYVWRIKCKIHIIGAKNLWTMFIPREKLPLNKPWAM